MLACTRRSLIEQLAGQLGSRRYLAIWRVFAGRASQIETIHAPVFETAKNAERG